MDMAPRTCPWGLQAPSMLPPTSSWPYLLPSKRIRGIYSSVREFPRGYSSTYQLSGISREYGQVCTTQSESTERIFKYVSPIQKFPRTLFSLYRTFGKFRNTYSTFINLSGISKWFNSIYIAISGVSEMVYMIDTILSEVSESFIQVV